MSKIILVLLSLLLIGMTAEAAFAKIRPIGHASASAVRVACQNAGGTFNQNGNTSYSCVKTNCDGNGGSCTVNCNNGSCTGNTPSRTTGQDSIIGTLFGIKKEPPRQSMPAGSLSDSVSGEAIPDQPSGGEVPDIGQPAPTPPPIL